MAEPGAGTEAEVDELWEEFHSLVNMTSRELRDWLRVESAQSDAEALPDDLHPRLGRAVLEILSKRRTDLTDDDLVVMRRVVSRIRREHPNLDRPGEGDDAWRRKLMDVGHDPLRPAPRGE